MLRAACLLLLAGGLGAAEAPPTSNAQVAEMAKAFKGRGVQADDTPPSTPAEALRKFTPRPGLTVDLLAAEPAVTQPIHGSWDSRGRLWVVQFRQYPFPAGLKVVSYDQHLRAQFDQVPLPPPGGIKGADVISVLEDTDGDGTYDKQTDVLKGLNITTAAVAGNGRLWVLNPPYLLSYGLEEGLPVGDPKVELAGFGLEDTHSTATNLQFHVDGWIYGVNGSTTTGDVGVPGGTRTRWSGQCVWRFHPTKKTFEIYAEGGGNTYSLDMDGKGRVFSGTNYGDTRGMHYEFGSYGVKNWGKHGPLTNPYAYGWFEHMANTGDKRRFPQAFVIYEGGLLGPEYEGKILAANSLANKAYVSRLIPQGATFRTEDEADLIASTDRWFRPVWTGVGPDGAVTVADWYDTRLSHVNPVDDWDKQRGRLYRIRPEGRNVGLKPFDLSKAPTAELVALLSHRNEWFRKQAVLEIGWRQLQDAVPALRTMLGGPQALEALWALDLLGAAGDPPVTHADPYVRRWSWQMLGERKAVPTAAQVAAARQETHLEVRAQILASAKHMPMGALPLLHAGADTSQDEAGRLRLLAWWALEAHLGSPEERTATLAFQWAAPGFVGSSLFRDTLAERLGKRLAHGANEGCLADAERVRALCPPEAAAKLIDGILTVLEPGDLPPMPAPLRTAIEARLGASGAKPLPLAALRAGDETALAAALKELTDKRTLARRRGEVADALSLAGRAEAIDPLVKLTLANGTEAKKALFLALSRYDDPRVPKAVIENYERSIAADDALRDLALRTLASRPAWARNLIDAVDTGKIPAPHITADIARALLRHADPEINAAVDRLWKPLLVTGLTPEKDREVARLRALARAGEGDATRGQAHFLARCANCHVLKGAGGDVGPDLTGYDRTSLDFWVLNIVYPSLEIREGFGSYDVRLKDGSVAHGILERRDGGEIILRDLAGNRSRIKEDKIATLIASPTSVMPEGLLAGMSDQDLRDFFAYLMR
ncbi:MAG: PVC-type heme-binding CxxCH protein [Opitutales bacterium]